MNSFRPEQGSDEAVATVRNLPAMMIEGMRDKALLAEHFVPLFKEVFPQAPGHCLENAGHFCLEDAPEEISRLILEFIESS